MEDLMLNDPLAQFFALYVGALVIINCFYATTKQPKLARTALPLRVEAKSADSTRRDAA